MKRRAFLAVAGAAVVARKLPELPAPLWADLPAGVPDAIKVTASGVGPARSFLVCVDKLANIITREIPEGGSIVGNAGETVVGIVYTNCDPFAPRDTVYARALPPIEESEGALGARVRRAALLAADWQWESGELTRVCIE